MHKTEMSEGRAKTGDENQMAGTSQKTFEIKYCKALFLLKDLIKDNKRFS